MNGKFEIILPPPQADRIEAAARQLGVKVESFLLHLLLEGLQAVTSHRKDYCRG